MTFSIHCMFLSGCPLASLFTSSGTSAASNCLLSVLCLYCVWSPPVKLKHFWRSPGIIAAVWSMVYFFIFLLVPVCSVHVWKQSHFPQRPGLKTLNAVVVSGWWRCERRVTDDCLYWLCCWKMTHNCAFLFDSRSPALIDAHLALPLVFQPNTILLAGDAHQSRSIYHLTFNQIFLFPHCTALCVEPNWWTGKRFLQGQSETEKVITKQSLKLLWKNLI